MLYERWQTIAKERANGLALYEWTSRRRWTFQELAAMVESRPDLDPRSSVGRIAYPVGDASVEFILAVLHAWKVGDVVCPLELDQSKPAISSPPPGIVHLKTTSATSGIARVVAFTAEQLAADAQHIVETMGLHPDSPNLSVISLSHSYGFSNLVTPLLLHGIPLILATSVFPEVFRQIVSTTPQLTVPAVPAVWRAWQEAGVLKGGLRLAVSAGAPLPIELEQAVFRTSGIKIHNFYGATESGGIAYDRSPEPRGDASFVGTPLNGVQVSVDSERCLNIASDAVGSSYWPDSDASLAGGRYVSADLGEIQDGRVFLRGRKNDLIHVAGRKVAPEEIEEILRQHPHVQNCLVFGIPADDVDRGEWIVACVVRREPVPEDALRQFLLKKIPAWQIPREWRWLETLDVNARGKLSRAEWRSRLFPGTRLPTIGSA